MLKRCTVIIAAVVLLGGCSGGAAQVDKPIVAPVVIDILDAQGVHADYTQMASPVGLTMTGAVGYQADSETLTKINESMTQFSKLLWQATCGNIKLDVVWLRNNSQDGYIHFEKLEKLGGHAQFGGPFTVNTNLLDIDKKMGKPGMGVKVLAAGIFHEFGHSMLRLQDEYNTDRVCIMHPQSRTVTFCVSCQKELLERFPLWRFPPESERAGWDEQHPVPVFQMEGAK
ncbi:MAG: hypothetical protein WC980_03420 [Candidatus Brocadiia bacterium]